MSIKAMKQALDLLKTSWGCGDQETADRWNETIDVLYEAIKQEKKRKWVGLTDEEVGGLTVFDGLTHIEVPILADFVRVIEAKLKEKNS